MTRRIGRCTGWMVAIGFMFAGLGAVNAGAQEYELYDRFSVALEGSWVDLGTTIRVDNSQLDRGTELDLESDLDLDASKTIPSVSIEWRPWTRHRFGFFWKDIDRSSTSQALEEIHFEDIVIPVEAQVELGFNISEYGVAYTYILRPRERSSFGFGGGLRVLELSTTLSARVEGEEDELVRESDAQVTGPLPFLGVEFRHMFSEKLRLQAELGVFYIEIDDIKGGQGLLRTSIEHLTFKNVGFGLGLDASRVKLDAEKDSWHGEAALDIYDVRLFVRVRL